MQLLSIGEVASRLGLSERSVRRMVCRKGFIEPIQVSPHRLRFSENEFTAWLARRPRGKFQQPTNLAVQA